MPGWTTRRRSPRSITACLARRKTSRTVAPVSRRTSRRRVTPRRISSWLSETRPKVRPRRAGRMSRTIVSTSGSSGMSPKCKGAYRARRGASRQPMSRRKILPSKSIASAVPRLRRWASANVGATAVTLRTRPPLTRSTRRLRPRCPAWKIVTPAGTRRGEGDRGALFRLVRIAARREHGGDGGRARRAIERRRALAPAPRSRAPASARRTRAGNTTWVSGSPSRQLNSTTQGSRRVHHESGVEHAAERAAAAAQLLEGGCEHLAPRAVEQRGRRHRTGLYAPMPPVFGPASPSSRRL